MEEPCIKHALEIKNLQAEYQEYPLFRFILQSKEYEEALEAENIEKDEKIRDLLQKVEDLQSETSILKKKYEKNENEISKLLTELEAQKKKVKVYEDQKRELEELNDH